ncbi:MAG TPA: molybdopterin cofactor-binding domain-containing protein, partial [Dehalococcoidia bacterium]|nr:molybdopterin cofactor-binding domain-containing protein [Dehalococcoidia bacterium]
TNANGHATLLACQELHTRLRQRAAQLMGCEPDDVVYEEARLYRSGDSENSLSVQELLARTPDSDYFNVKTQVELPIQRDVTCFCAQVAELEVDPETGQVRLHRFVTAHDVSTIFNPIAHQGQIDGGVIQGIAMALSEELVHEEGRVTTLHLGDYKLPTAPDIPPLETVLVPVDVGPGPYEAKAIGEMANCSPPAAIANAVEDAIGVRLFDLPITAEKVYRALQEKGNRAG